jgi:hypothetical protein
MTALLEDEHTPGRPEMREKPRLFDALGLVALPTAISCARLFVKYTLDNWRASSFVVADAMTIVGELVALSVQETGVLDDKVVWSELGYINRVVVRLLGFPRHIVIAVWDAATKAAALPAGPADTLPRGLDLVDVLAGRWASTASPRGRLTWAELPVYDRTDAGLPINRRRPRPHPALPAPVIDEELLRRVRDGLTRW